ncbi:centrosomal protein of 44 kDa-like [Clytia hemisphaerica]|uniref:Centrosomal protein of 44 kDa n=1 Tax=Clytia hemisphaerica TaxID=252671 RepID=A0A7M5V6V7_9CNID
MTTGDVKNNLRKLKTELRLIKYKEEIPWQQINVGLTEPLLPILHYVFGDYSCEFTSYLGAKGYDFFCKSDLRFIEIVFKILVTEFNLKPMLTKQQFFAVGFAEIKVIFVTKIISLCRTKNMAILAKLKKPRKQVQVKQSISLDCIAQRENTSKVDFHIEPNECEIPIKIIKDPTIQGKCTPNDVLDLTTVDQISDDEVNNLVNTGYDSISTVRDVLDLSEINGDDNIEKLIDDESRLFIDNNEDICGNNLPRFTVLKNALPEVRLVEESIVNELDGEAKVKNMNEITLESCTQCINNTKKMSVMENRISSLEKKFTASVKLNNELSAKIILLETKVNLLESSSSKRAEEKDEFVDSTSMISDEKQITQPTLYSPLKYSDDDTIMKGFRPITMKDVRAAHGINSGQVDGKENHPRVVVDPATELKCISTSSNRNVSFDSKTKETIFNVEKYFQDADQLLSARSSVERF